MPSIHCPIRSAAGSSGQQSLESIRVQFFTDLSVSKSEACSGSLERFGFILIDAPRSESTHTIFRCEHVSEIDKSFQWISLGASKLHWDPLSFVTAGFFGVGSAECGGRSRHRHFTARITKEP